MDYYINLLGNLGPIHDGDGTNKDDEAKEIEEEEGFFVVEYDFTCQHIGNQA